MGKKILLVLVSVAVLFLTFKSGRAEELSLQPFLYTQDFEEKDPVKFFTAFNGKYIVNFKGLTEEKAFSGKRSFKLDVTFQEGSCFYWRIPIVAPAEGKLNFSGRIFVEKADRASAGLGCWFYLRPPFATGSGRFGKFGSTEGEWKLIQGDIVKRGKEIKSAAPKYGWGVGAENVGVYFDKIVFYLYGGKGQRVIIYVDDLKIEGEVPTEGDYKKEIERRYAPVKERIERKVIYWEDSLRKIYKGLSLFEGEKREEFETKVNPLIVEVGNIREKGIIRVDQEKRISSSIKEIKKEIERNSLF